MKRRVIGTIVAIALVVGGLALFELGGWLNMGQVEETVAPTPSSAPERPEPEEEEEEPSEFWVDSYEQIHEVGVLMIAGDRRDYVSGSMTLSVPRMNFEGPVYAGPVSEDTLEQGSGGVSDEILDQGVGLFGLSQLPDMAANANVCIAGHRDIHGMEFYDIDKITDGDLMYVAYNGWEYTYEYLETVITEDDDWQMIRTRDIGCLTLQSCTPINVASHRIFVVGKLVKVTRLDA